MKFQCYYVQLFLIGILFSCSEKNKENKNYSKEVYVHPPYDTTAIDSFGPGAKQMNIAENIYKSSQSYQDSLKKRAEEIAAEKEKNLLLEAQKLEAQKKDSLKKVKAKESPKKNEIPIKQDTI